MNGDTPIKRKTFLEMTKEEQFFFIKNKQDKRLEAYSIYNEVKLAKLKAKSDKLNEKLQKKLLAFMKLNENCDKQLQKLSEKANELNMIKLEIELLG